MSLRKLPFCLKVTLFVISLLLPSVLLYTAVHAAMEAYEQPFRINERIAKGHRL